MGGSVEPCKRVKTLILQKFRSKERNGIVNKKIAGRIGGWAKAKGRGTTKIKAKELLMMRLFAVADVSFSYGSLIHSNKIEKKPRC